jgi:rSAM/selenodomain-associated transferase 1
VRHPEGRILVFAKAPVPGRAKTRLIPALGAVGAAALQARLIEQTLATATRAELCPVELWCAPDARDPRLRALGARFNLPLRTQHGADLGERMRDALAGTLSAAPFAVLIGTDCPALTAAYLEEAIAGLSAGQDVVLGPVEDGGYALIGARRVAPALFEEIPWGSDAVLSHTCARLRHLGWDWRLLATLWDLDRPADLARLARA